MPQNVVFLVHGIGRHSATSWAEPWKASIVENLRQYAPYAGKSREEIEAEDLAFRPISYDAVFEEAFRAGWNGLAGALADVAVPSGLRRVLEAVQSEEAEGVEAIFWDYVLDVLLWYSLTQARERVIASVAMQFADGAREAIASGGRLHIVAHSMGTSVVHDTLLAMTDPALTDGVFDYEESGLRWDSLTQVANVSRLLAATRSPSSRLEVDDFKPHRSRVRPGNGGLVRRFVDARHALDPFTFPRSFHPDWTRYGGHTFRVLQRFDSPKGVHDFATHFDCPGVHQASLREITGRGSLGTTAESEAAWGRYDRLYGRDVSAALSELRQILEPSTERKLGAVELGAYLLHAARVVLA